jgi:hypothetical protein
MKASFEPDSRIHDIAEAYALDAVDVAQRFGRILDWSDASIEHVETILTRMHDAIASEGPSAEQIYETAKGFGSYIGEVYRRNHGARWGLVTLGDQSFPGMESNSAVRFWPWGKVQNRLTNGSEDNVWYYYKSLISSV